MSSSWFSLDLKLGLYSDFPFFIPRFIDFFGDEGGHVPSIRLWRNYVAHSPQHGYEERDLTSN